MIRAAAISLTAILICTSTATAQAPAPPPGWTRLTDVDLDRAADWEFRKDRPDRYVRATGDFDGNGVPDRAEYLADRAAGKWALFAFMNGSAMPLKLDEGPLTGIGRLGVSVAAAGRVQTACGKGFDNRDPQCKKGAAFVDLAYQSIDCFVFESSAWRFYWKDGAFHELWTSD